MTLAAFLTYIYVYGYNAVAFVVANWGTISSMISFGTSVYSIIKWVLSQI